MVAAVVAANAPDIDLAYTGITEAPLGYLLHHRGHSHTLPGLLAIGAAILMAVRWWPAARRAINGGRIRFYVMVVAALLSHLLLDASNSYGTLLLYPWSSRWFYGDAVFILEPSLWILLGVVAALNAQRLWTRVLVWVVTVAPTVVLGVFGLVTPVTAAVLALTGAGLAVGMASRPACWRAAIALGGAAVIFLGMFVVSGVARTETQRHVAAAGAGPIVDIVLNAGPAAPWCWSVLTIERSGADAGLLVRRGTLSLLPGVVPPGRCVAHRIAGMADATADSSMDALIWNREWQVDLAELRALQASDCRVRPWLQFGRVPYVADGRIADLRFDNPLRDNFSAMEIAAPSGGGCPTNVPGWQAPRADVLSPP